VPATFEFDAELWEWSARQDSWVFVTVPQHISDEIDDLIPNPAGFGSVKVAVRVGSTEWSTSLFPDASSGTFVLPIKKAVRTAESLDAGDVSSIWIEVVHAAQ